MTIEIESRESIEERAGEPFPAHTALISIADADADFIVLKNNPEYLLQLKFDDISADILEEIIKSHPAIKEAMQAAKMLHWFSDEQAEETAAFIMTAADKAELIICQCEYGQLRSAGIAAAIMQFFSNDGIEIFADERYYPNKLVYKKVLAALQGSANNS